MSNNPQHPELIAQYLIAEFSALHQRADQKEQLIATKISGYLTSTSIVAGGVLLATESALLTNYAIHVVWAVLLIITLIGSVTFSQILDLRASAQFFYRRAGRVRKWFLDFEPTLQPYIPFSVGDNTPSFYERNQPLRSNEEIVVLINSGSAAALTCITMNLIMYRIEALETVLNSTGYWLFIACFGVALLVLYWQVHFYTIKKVLLKREQDESQQGKILFPVNNKWYVENKRKDRKAQNN